MIWKLLFDYDSFFMLICLINKGSLLHLVTGASLSNLKNELFDSGNEKEKCAWFFVSDPEWNKYWYLNTTSEGMTDMNVIPAWRKCYNGTGITVAVVDDGIHDNPDLNVDRSISVDVAPWIPSTKRHGTRVAGIIAGKRSNFCGIGIAFGSTLVDIRLLAGIDVPHTNRSHMLISSLEQIDIYSNSFIARHDGISIHNLNPIVFEALRKGTKEGRKGYGAIYVWATGNGGDDMFPHGCAYDGYDNTPYVIPVSGVQWNYTKVPTGESCSAIMVSAFTRNPFDTKHKIVTTSGENGCDDSFNRNSAAVPMVSGAIALALQSNPLVGYRDIMHMLTMSSNNKLPFQPNDFIRNSAGFSVSQTFGFGLLDIDKLVDMASTWKNVPPSVECVLDFNMNCSLFNNRTAYVTEDNCNIKYIEHAEVYFSTESSRAGRLRLDLFSPMGTESNIVPGRKFDRRNKLTLTVISVHYWGESPHGQWLLIVGDIENDVSGLRNGTMLHWRLRLYGMQTNPFSNSGETSTSSNGYSSSRETTSNTTLTNTLPTGETCVVNDASYSLTKTVDNQTGAIVGSICGICVLIIGTGALLKFTGRLKYMRSKLQDRLQPQQSNQVQTMPKESYTAKERSLQRIEQLQQPVENDQVQVQPQQSHHVQTVAKKSRPTVSGSVQSIERLQYPVKNDHVQTQQSHQGQAKTKQPCTATERFLQSTERSQHPAKNASSYLRTDSSRLFAVSSEGYRKSYQVPMNSEFERYMDETYYENLLDLIHTYLELRETDRLCYVGDSKGSFAKRIADRFCLLKPVMTVFPGHYIYPESNTKKLLSIPTAHTGSEEYFRQNTNPKTKEKSEYDKIVLKDAIYYFENPAETFTNIMNSVATGGKMLIIHRPENFRTLSFYNDAEQRFPENVTSYMDILKTLQSCNFDIEWEFKCLPISIFRENPQQMETWKVNEILSGFQELGFLTNMDRLLFITVAKSQIKKDMS